MRKNDKRGRIISKTVLLFFNIQQRKNVKFQAKNHGNAFKKIKLIFCRIGQ